MQLSHIKRLLVGEPMSTHMLHNETIPKWKALAVLSSDALSSVAYATEEILIPLAMFSAAAVAWSVPIAICIVTLMIIVTVSYRQVISVYQHGGGAYTVAKENLGVGFGLVAAASLLIDYVLTVAVSVSAGVSAITSAFPWLIDHKVFICSLIVLVIMTLNLRGIRESATIFALPTYGFIVSFFLMLVVGVYKVLTGHMEMSPPVTSAVLGNVEKAIPTMLLLRAFASGCTAMTGIEAISNGVPVFERPSHENAKKTMFWMTAILSVLFTGITWLSHQYQILPVESETVVSQLARDIFGTNGIYYIIQGSTALILVLAANTAYSDFPRLSALLSRDRFLPRQLAMLGDRLVFSNSIIGLSIAAIVLLILFQGETHYLIPLYAVGVFMSFTLSQSGMVRYHIKHKQPRWVGSLVINALGALTTFVVMIVLAVTKFTHGAWIVILLIPIVVLIFTRILKHYLDVGKELSLVGVAVPEKLKPMKHTVIVPISGVHRGVIDALRYAMSISDDVRACYVELDADATERMQVEWAKWAHDVPIVVLKSPYRSVIRPVLEYIDDVEETTNREFITVVIPEFVTAKWWHSVLHNQTALLIRASLMLRRGKVVTSVRYHLKST
jgi:amino acid transporter